MVLDQGPAGCCQTRRVETVRKCQHSMTELRPESRGEDRRRRPQVNVGSEMGGGTGEQMRGGSAA